MDARDLLLSTLAANGGWPFGVKTVEMDRNLNIYFDGIILRGLVERNQEVRWGVAVPVILTEEEFRNKKPA